MKLASFPFKVDYFDKYHEWQIPSSSEEGVFRTVRRYPHNGQDLFTCSCPGYFFLSKKHLFAQCRHIKQVKRGLVQHFIYQLEGKYHATGSQPQPG